MNKTPLKSLKTISDETPMELRMYGMVPYQLKGIQGGIQFGHSKDEFTAHIIEHIINSKIYPEEVRKTFCDTIITDSDIVEKYLDWLKNWKTYIVLDGGTTNTNPETLGTLNQHLKTLKEKGVFVTEFYEPDMGDQLLGIAFLVDERVFNREKYPDLKWMNDSEWKNTFPPDNPIDPKYRSGYDEMVDWIVSIGGSTNYFLRNFLPKFKLASN
jgi:hypothetical protein